MQTDSCPIISTDLYSGELQQLLLAEDASLLQQCLIRSFNRLQVAGYSRFSFASVGDVRASIRVTQIEDLSGALNGVPKADVAAAVQSSAPAWLVRWVLLRKHPFWLHRFARFIPFSSRLILRASAPSGRPALVDLVTVTHWQLAQPQGIMIGLHQPATQIQAEQLMTIASAYLLKQVATDEPLPANASAAPPRGALNARQIECLAWLVAGKSLEEVALITGTSYSNVRYHLARAKRQTGLPSLQQLLAYAAVEYRLSPLGPERGLDSPPQH